MMRRNPGEIFRVSPKVGPISLSLTLYSPVPFRGVDIGIKNQTLKSASPLEFETGIIELGPLVLGIRIRR